MEIDKAKYLLQTYAKTTMNNTFMEAANEVLEYIKQLENKLNNKEKVILIDQEEVILQITNLSKRLNNERNKKEEEYEKTISLTKRALRHHELDLIDAKQKAYSEIIELIRSL